MGIYARKKVYRDQHPSCGVAFEARDFPHPRSNRRPEPDAICFAILTTSQKPDKSDRLALEASAYCWDGPGPRALVRHLDCGPIASPDRSSVSLILRMPSVMNARAFHHRVWHGYNIERPVPDPHHVLHRHDSSSLMRALRYDEVASCVR